MGTPSTSVPVSGGEQVCRLSQRHCDGVSRPRHYPCCDLSSCCHGDRRSGADASHSPRTDRSSISVLAAILRQVASPGITPNELVAGVREKQPDVTKKEIVRAAVFDLSDGQDANPTPSGAPHEFALKERASHPAPAVKRPKWKKNRTDAKAGNAAA